MGEYYFPPGTKVAVSMDPADPWIRIDNETVMADRVDVDESGKIFTIAWTPPEKFRVDPDDEAWKSSEDKSIRTVIHLSSQTLEHGE